MSRPKRVLVACETSGIVRNAFLDAGHDAWSCDILPADDRTNRHITGDARALLNDGWDLLMVAHPPCTRLCKSGLRWLHTPPPGRTLDEMMAELDQGAAFFSEMWNAPIDRIAVENPRMHRMAQTRIQNYRQYDQEVQPWQHGHGETKGICLWLKSLPPLQPTNVVKGREARVHRSTGWGAAAKTRRKARSRFFPGIATAMAQQWGGAA